LQHSICVLMCNTMSVNNFEFILLKYKCLTSYLTNKLVVGHQPFDRLVVSIQSEIGAIKIGPKMYESLYNSKRFPLV
jgi:hypothetical protein